MFLSSGVFGANRKDANEYPIMSIQR